MDHRVCPEAVAALERGHLIDAIRLVRADTGLGLAEAKSLVERYQRGEIDAGAADADASERHRTSSPAHGLPSAAEAALARGRVIEAIKIVRRVEGIDLKAAKQRVDEVRSRMSRKGATGIGFAGPAERRRPFALVFVLVAVLCLAWYVLLN